MSLLRVALAFLAAGAAWALDLPSTNSVVAHEWGTFTSVAGLDGKALPWASLAGSADLPCFVAHLKSIGVKYTPGLVRMETPVLYFYSDHPATVAVHVEFPQGVITEWYPRATKVAPDTPTIYQLAKGQIDWDAVELTPGDAAKLPSSKGASRYYAARATDSTPLAIGGQQEKLIFYRGVGDPPVPLEATFSSDGRLDIRNTSAQAVPLAILFQNANGNIGYRVVHQLRDGETLDPPELTASIDELRAQLAGDLEVAGLNEKEALAMLATWGDSWFEEGTRLFYIVPREQVDEQLPLTITPAPSATERVFVGRIELLAPWQQEAIETAIQAQDTASLVRLGRFLDPFLMQMQLKKGNSQRTGAVEAAYTQLEQRAKASACIE